MQKTQKENEICIELHYDFADSDTHSINFYTRNSCSLAQAEIISFVIESLYPEQQFEILSLATKEGSLKDFAVVKFISNSQNTILLATAISTVAAVISILLYSSQKQVNQSTDELNTLAIFEKCKGYDLDDLQIEKIKEICASFIPKKQKNIFYESIISNNEVMCINPKFTQGTNEVFSCRIEKNNFEDYIEKIPKEKEFLKTDLTGHIQLSQPYIDRQQQYGRGVPWKGIYYGLDILDENDELIIGDGANVLFYMQDANYKNQILNQEVNFTSGDNINVVFDISRNYDFVSRKFGGSRMYVKRVVHHNDNLVEHKKNLLLKKEKQRFDEKNSNQGLLFDGTSTQQ
ncbi:MAG: hypothetical protein WAX38_04660 [Minisyncoccia bacterium]